MIAVANPTERYRVTQSYVLRSSAKEGQNPNNVARWLASAVVECGGTVEGTQTRGPVAFVRFTASIPARQFRDDLRETIGSDWNMRKDNS